MILIFYHRRPLYCLIYRDFFTGSHITKKKRDAIVKLHRQGESIELLTAISGLNRTTITSIIKKDDSEKLFREFNMVSEKLSFER